MDEMAEIKDIESKIYNIRGVEVMLDSDLAEQYKCANGTKIINQAVKRNQDRFLIDFYFQLHGGVRKMPYTLTEKVVYMLVIILKLVENYYTIIYN